MLFNKIKHKPLIKKKIINYVKLFKFKTFFFSVNLNISCYKNIINIFKTLISIKSFGAFISDNLKIKSLWLYPFWKDGYISNFLNLRWYFVKISFLKKLPSIIINLTKNNIISVETTNKNIPLIFFLKVKLKVIIFLVKKIIIV